MKKNSRGNFYRYVIFLLLFTACNREQAAHSDDRYTCPMHPQIIQDTPGVCPICGMNLILKNQKGEEIKITKELGYLLKPTNALVISSIKTLVPVKRKLETTLEAKGLIAHDTRKIATIPARFGGRIEKLYIKYNFQPVKKGEKIMEIYSPELITVQRELLFLLESDAGNATLIESSKQKLRLLGISENQINKLIESKKESYSFAIYSPVDGYVTSHAMTEEKNSVMESKENASENSIQLREGMYVAAGETVFAVVSHSDLWAEFDLSQHDVPYIKLKDTVLITFDNTYGNMKATVDFVQPFFKDGESLIKVRMYLTNSHFHFHAGQLVTASFKSYTNELMWIPKTARLNLGMQNVAFVKRRGVFKPIAIFIGRESAGWIEVRSGIDLYDTIAYNAHFMMDSESFIKVNQNN